MMESLLPLSEMIDRAQRDSSDRAKQLLELVRSSDDLAGFAEYCAGMEHRLLELELESREDRLTKVMPRREIERFLSRELARTARFGTPTAVAFVDVDHFKEVNDVHGHSAGDDVLRAIGELLNSSVRKVDAAGRMGGEEFVVVLSDADERAAATFAENLRRKIERLRPAGLGVTASVGIAVAQDDGAEGLLKRADAAMYAAKRSGRNAVRRWTGS